jgi:serine/threonine protein kinase
MRVVLVANQGQLGGGEVMLLRLAAALKGLNQNPLVLAPNYPSEVASLAETQFDTLRVRGRTRVSYATHLQSFRRWRTSRFWCNGLLPALALSGTRQRVIHLHQLPQGRSQAQALRIARRGNPHVVVPSAAMRGALGFGEVLWNWSPEVKRAIRPEAARLGSAADLTVGFMGRISSAKGVDLALAAVTHLRHTREYPELRLEIFGDQRFVSSAECNQVNQLLAQAKDYVGNPGWVSPENAFGSMNVALFPSRQFEAFGLVLIEAMSARVPFVASDAGAFGEVAGEVTREITGEITDWVGSRGYPRRHPWIFPTGKVAECSARLAHLLHTPDLLLLEHNYQRWRQNFSPQAGQKNLRHLLERWGWLG